MKYLKATILFLLFCFTRSVWAEEIGSFLVAYNINADGTVGVTETIEYDFGEVYKHGIFRTLETEHPQPATVWYKNRTIDYELKSVWQDGQPIDFTLDRQADKLVIKIGDPNRTITGNHTYTLDYTLRGALSYGQSGSEFYFDVTGNSWSVPIKQAIATLTGTKPDMLGQAAACYEGAFGSQTTCAISTTTNQSVIFTATGLNPYEGLTIAQSLNPETVAILVNEEPPAWPTFALLLLVYLGAGGFYIRRFLRQYNPQASIVVEYEPYPDVLPMYTGVVVDGRLDPKDITAGLLYLAEQGFLKIRKTERKVMFLFEVSDYELTLKRPLTEAPNTFSETILGLLFKVDEVGSSTKLSDLKKDRLQLRANALTIQNLKQAVRKDLRTKGIYENFPWSGYRYLGGGALLTAVTALFLLTSDLLKLFLFLLVLGSALLLLVGQRRLTKHGYQIRNHLLGFKDFLSVTEKERYKFHNTPAKNPQQFMAFLPYAIAFGVEQEWAEVFSNLSLPAPDWYDGGSIGSFSAAALSRDLGAFSSSFSASSGSSGSSGGGSSGGGGGGGGGGSW